MSTIMDANDAHHYPEMQAVTAIQARAITKTYGNGVHALRGVSFDIGSSQIFAYLGRNGSGKTTTVRILTTLTRPTSGGAMVGGIDVTANPRGVRALVGVTMQEAALDDLMTGREHLELIGQLWRQPPRAARQRAEELLEAFGLSDAANRRVGAYSGGMRRRLDLATALFDHPRILFLDEPTTGLDPQSRRAVWSMIRALRDSGTTVFLTTQYLEEADELADTVGIVDRGQMVAMGTVDQLKSSHGRTAMRMRHAPGVDLAPMHEILGRGAAIVAADGWLHIDLVGPGNGSQLVVRLLGHLRLKGIPVEDLSVTQASLEDVFVRLTGGRLDGTAAVPQDGAGSASHGADGYRGEGR